MIITWMVASTLFALLLGSAAWLAERALVSAGRPRRAPWTVAIGIATVWPLIAGAWFLASPQLPPVALITTRIGTNAAEAVTARFASGLSLQPFLDRGLVAFWVIVSLLLVARIIVGLVRMRSVVRGAKAERLNDTDVLVTDATGPAVCGVRHPQIVVPRWIKELDAPLRAMVLRHEQEHRDRGDSGLVLGGALAVALVPWNPVVWMMVRRLRLAIELDCDGRVLARDTDVNRYGRLLMLVTQRQSQARLLPMLAESNAHLERRISAMNTPNQNRSRVRAAALGIAATVVAVLAGSTPVMAGVTNPSSGNTVLKLPAAIAQGSQAQAKRMPPPPPPAPAKAVVVAKDAPPPPPPPPQQGVVEVTKHIVVARDSQGKPFFEFTVSTAAQPAQGSQNPRYPDILRSAGVEGNVVVQLVVMADGTPMEGSMRVLSSSHKLFDAAVVTAFPNMRYTPATVEGRAVRQLVQQTFEFRIADTGGVSAEVFRGDTIVRKVELNQVHKVPTTRITATKPPQH